MANRSRCLRSDVSPDLSGAHANPEGNLPTCMAGCCRIQQRHDGRIDTARKLSVGSPHPSSKPFSRFLRTDFRRVFHDNGYLFCEVHRGVDDQEHVQRLRELSISNDVPLVVAGDVHYHTADRMLMHDCLTAIHHGTTIDKAHEKRFT